MTQHAKLCQTQRADVIAASMKCFNTGICHTYSDPGETSVENCLTAVYAEYPTAAATAVESSYAAKCDVPLSSLAYPEVPFVHLNDATNTAMKACVDAAADCPTAEACYWAQFPAIADCATVCQVGWDPSCNDDATMTGLAGTCSSPDVCTCNPGYVNAPSGKCAALGCAGSSSSTLSGVSIVVDSQLCTYTLEEAQAGITFSYRIIVSQDTPGVIAKPQDTGGCMTPGSSGLSVFTKITEGSQVYCPACDVGLCAPTTPAAAVLKQGVYPDTFTWDGKTWNGPSDTSNPEGPPFTTGSVTVSLSAIGTVNGTAFTVSAAFPITLTP
jgi:hypothetical protein